MTSRARIAIILIVGVAVVVSATYGGAALLAYDRLSKVSADCGGRFAENTPASWSVDSASGQSGPHALDLTRYFVEAYETVRVPSRDEGIDLHGWWLPPRAGQPAPAVIVVHGRGSCVREPNMLLPAGMLHRAGYGVLMLDLRDHGASTVEDGRYAGGTEEFRDVQGAVDWLETVGAEPGVGALGMSLGAATVMIAAGQDARIVAVWEDSGYADVIRRTADELQQEGLPEILAPAAAFAARVVSGDDLSSHTVLGEMPLLSGRHLFITHGAADTSTTVSHALDLDEAARTHGVESDLWIVPEAGHVEAMFLQPDEYERRLGAFFDGALDADGVVLSGDVSTRGRS